MNVFVHRDDFGRIDGVYAAIQLGIAEEKKDEGDPEVVSFITGATINGYENAIQNLIDQTAHARQFRDGVTLASYIGSTKPQWASEAQAFVAWRDNVWHYAYGELAKVQAGQRPQPTIEEFLGEIAPIAWPFTSATMTSINPI